MAPKKELHWKVKAGTMAFVGLSVTLELPWLFRRGLWPPRHPRQRVWDAA